MKRYFIINHLGLGDHIICNALYRHYCDKGNTVIIPVKAHNTQAVQDMFSDKENAFVLSLNSGSPDEEMVSSSVEYASMGYELVRLGNFGSNFLVDQSTRYDHNFYNQAGVDFDERWNSFYAPSNQERAEEVYEFLCGAN